MLRHGQSEWNALGRWQGQADPPLSELGERQAAAAADNLPRFDAVVASDLDRAVQTATILAERAGLGPVRTDPALRERAAGEWEGLDRTQIEEAWPGYLAERRRPPGFENDDVLLDRTEAALSRLVAEFGGKQLLVVCHGGVIRAHERRLGEQDGDRVPNLGGRWLHHDPTDDFTLGDRIVLIDENVTAPAET